MTIAQPPPSPLSPFPTRTGPVHPQTNNPKLPWLVQKFGGTSVGKLPLGIVEVVKYVLRVLIKSQFVRGVGRLLIGK